MVDKPIPKFELDEQSDLPLWVQIRDRKDTEGRSAEDNVKALLKAPAEMRVLALVAIGHKGMERKPQNEERLKWDKVHTEAW